MHKLSSEKEKEKKNNNLNHASDLCYELQTCELIEKKTLFVTETALSF